MMQLNGSNGVCNGGIGVQAALRGTPQYVWSRTEFSPSWEIENARLGDCKGAPFGHQSFKAPLYLHCI